MRLNFRSSQLYLFWNIDLTQCLSLKCFVKLLGTFDAKITRFKLSSIIFV